MQRLILASGSASRAALLTGAGIAFDRIPSDVDEDAIKRELEAAHTGEGEYGAGPAIATALAEAKALKVAASDHQALVVGADQVLTLDGHCYDKPKDLAEARGRLAEFRGRTHVLHSGIALIRERTVLWTHYEASALTMRDFSDTFLDDYLARAGAAICSSVGAYHLEGLGAQLFDKIEGDYFAILGLPLLPLMTELRRHGVLAA